MDELTLLAYVATHPSHPSVVLLTERTAHLADLRARHSDLTQQILDTQVTLDRLLQELAELATPRTSPPE